MVQIGSSIADISAILHLPKSLLAAHNFKWTFYPVAVELYCHTETMEFSFLFWHVCAFGCSVTGVILLYSKPAHLSNFHIYQVFNSLCSLLGGFWVCIFNLNLQFHKLHAHKLFTMIAGEDTS